MPVLPGPEALGGLPPATSGRQILASVDTSAVGRAVANFGQQMEQGAAQLKSSWDRNTALNADAAWQKFQLDETQTYNDAVNKTTPEGAAGFTQSYLDGYKQRAKSFLDTLPAQLKEPYTAKLMANQAGIYTAAHGFERTQQTTAATNSVTDGLNNGILPRAGMAGATLDDPTKKAALLKQAEADAVGLVQHQVDAGYITPIQAEDLKRQARAKVQASFAERLPAQERVGLAAPSGAVPGSFADTVTKAANKYGLDPALLLGMAKIESSSGSDTSTSSAGAQGPFQFIPSTAKAYGLTNPQDVAQSADAAARYALDNKKALASALGREPTNGEIYLAHQQGSAGAIQLLTHPNELAASLVGAPAVTQNGGKAGMTASQFAHVWTDRFSGSSSVSPAVVGGKSIVSTAPVSPYNLDALKYEDRVKLADSGQAELDKAANQGRIDAAREQTANIAAVHGAIDLGIETGDINDPKVIFSSGLPDAEQATLLRQLEAKNAGAIKTGDAVGRIQAGDSFNPLIAKDVSDADLAYKAFGGSKGLMGGDPKASQMLGAFVRQTHIVPASAMDELRAAGFSNDPTKLASAATIAASVMAQNPMAFDPYPGGAEMTNLGTAFAHLVNDRGMTSQEAAQHLIDARKPENVRTAKELAPAAGAFVKKLSTADVVNPLTSGGFLGIGASTPLAGYTPAMEASMLGDYTEIAKEYFLGDAHGDEGVAKALALKDMSRLYGVSTVSNTPVLMKYPPEKYYPPIDGTVDYLKGAALHQAAEDYKAQGFKAEIGPDKKIRSDQNAAEAAGHAGVLDARLVATPETASDIRNHAAPRYELQYSHLVDGQEIWETVHGGLFQAPNDQLQGAVAAVKAQKDTAARAQEPALKENIDAAEGSRAARLKASAPVDLSAPELQPPVASPQPAAAPLPTIGGPGTVLPPRANPMRRDPRSIPTLGGR